MTQKLSRATLFTQAILDELKAKTYVEIQTKLAKGIEAAKQGDYKTAQDMLYDVVEAVPRNEAAWVWLSYVVDTVEDRKICLENVLAINPKSDYALRSLAKMAELEVNQTEPTAPIIEKRRASRGASRVSFLPFVTAFWAGLGILLLLMSIQDGISTFIVLLASSNFPSYITPIQLWRITITIAFLVASIVALNVAWGLYLKSRIGYYISLLFSLGLIFAGPLILLLPQKPNYFLVIIAGLLPIGILFLSIFSQTGLEHEPTMVVDAR